MQLILNTTDRQTVEILLTDGKKVFHRKVAAPRHSEKLLISIEKLLRDQKVPIVKIKGIGVVSGPGGFAPLRVGVVTANTLAYALRIPVVGIKLTEFKTVEDLLKKIDKKLSSKKNFTLSKNIVLPFYGQEPNITT